MLAKKAPASLFERGWAMTVRKGEDTCSSFRVISDLLRGSTTRQAQYWNSEKFSVSTGRLRWWIAHPAFQQQGTLYLKFSSKPCSSICFKSPNSTRDFSRKEVVGFRSNA
jgi:hypothetical protein